MNRNNSLVACIATFVEQPGRWLFRKQAVPSHFSHSNLWFLICKSIPPSIYLPTA